MAHDFGQAQGLDAMLVTQYNEFVHQTDQYKHKPRKVRRAIALYGLVGEIGSLLAAVKKNLLAEAGEASWDHVNDEIVEELGDIVWYCFSIAQIENEKDNVNIFTNDIAQLKKEISADNERANSIRRTLDPRKKDAFLFAAENFPNTVSMRLSDYQRLAFLTARTEGQVLMEVCLAVLWQLGAELLRATLPPIEIELNRNVADRPVNIVLGEIAWHLAAICTLYGKSLDEIAKANMDKVNYRADRSQKTPLHDANRDVSEQIPRQFDVSFVTVAPGRSRMYLNGRKLGDELTDNAYDDDGYRFHDVMHLSNIAHLGWSPVLRDLLGKKRKRDAKIDEVEDGARAKIVEELVLKIVHSEGEKASLGVRGSELGAPVRHFPSRKSITFKLLKDLHKYVEGLEAEKNKFWEWEDAIFDGAEVFHKLRSEEQGTVSVDLDKRTLKFSPDVCVEISGVVAGLGSASISNNVDHAEIAHVLSDVELTHGTESGQPDMLARMVCAKRAIFDSISLTQPSSNQFHLMRIKLLDSTRVCVKASGQVVERLWEKRILAFRLTFNVMAENLTCMAVAVADVRDLAA